MLDIFYSAETLASILPTLKNNMPRRSTTHEEFDAKLAVKNPRVIRVGIYKNDHTKIEFKCLIHNKIRLSRPGDVLRGVGLACCHSNKLQIKLAAENYDEKLRIKNPKLKRVGTYLGSKKKILHECLIHKEIHLSTPNQCLAGRGLSCCGRINTLRHAVSINKQPTELYLFNLRRFSNYVKTGISVNIKERKDEEYGEQILIKKLNSRVEAYLVEQAILQDKRLVHDCPEEMHLNRWTGWTEVRKCSKDVAKQVVNEYLAELEKIGLNSFAKKYLTLTPAEKALLDKKFPPP